MQNQVFHEGSMQARNLVCWRCLREPASLTREWCVPKTREGSWAAPPEGLGVGGAQLACASDTIMVAGHGDAIVPRSSFVTSAPPPRRTPHPLPPLLPPNLTSPPSLSPPPSLSLYLPPSTYLSLSFSLSPLISLTCLSPLHSGSPTSFPLAHSHLSLPLPLTPPHLSPSFSFSLTYLPFPKASTSLPASLILPHLFPPFLTLPHNLQLPITFLPHPLPPPYSPSPSLPSPEPPPPTSHTISLSPPPHTSKSLFSTI